MTVFVQAHIEQCIYRLQRCKYCREEIPFINLQVNDYYQFALRV